MGGKGDTPGKRKLTRTNRCGGEGWTIVATSIGAAPHPLARVAPARVLRLGPDDRRGGLTSGVPHGCAREARRPAWWAELRRGAEGPHRGHSTAPFFFTDRTLWDPVYTWSVHCALVPHRPTLLLHVLLHDPTEHALVGVAHPLHLRRMHKRVSKRCDFSKRGAPTHTVGFGTEPRYRIYASSIILQRSQTLHTSHQVMTDTNQTHYYVPTGHGNHAKACSHDVLCTRARPASQFESIPEVYRRWFSHVGPVSVCASVVHPCPAHAPSCQRAQESWYGCLMVWYELLVVLWYGMVWVRRVSFPRRRPTVTLVAGEVDMRPLLPLVARVRAARR